MRYIAFAVTVVGVDFVVWLPPRRAPQLGERIQLKCQSRMPGRHDSVRCELVTRAEMTGKAQFAASADIPGREHAGVPVRLECCGRYVVVIREPVFRAAVTGLAADAIGQVEAFAATRRRDIVAVAVEADFRSRR